VTAPALAQAEASAGVWWRSLAPLSLVTVLVGLAGAFLMPLLPVFLNQQVKASPLQASVFLFLSPVAAIVVSNVVARISDRPGARQWVIYVAASSGAIGFALYAVVRHYAILLAVSLTLVAMSTAIVPQVYALGREVILREAPSRVTMGTNTLRMMMSLAWAAGAPLGAFILAAIDFDGLFVATALMYLVVLGIVVALRDTLFRSRQPVAPAPTVDGLPTAAGEVAPIVVDGGPTTDSAPTPAAMPSKAMIAAITVAFVLLQAVTVLTVTAMPLFVSVDLRGTLASAGSILGLCAAIEIPLMLAFGMLAARWPLHRLLVLGGLCGVAYCLAVSLAASVWQVAAAQVPARLLRVLHRWTGHHVLPGTDPVGAGPGHHAVHEHRAARRHALRPGLRAGAGPRLPAGVRRLARPGSDRNRRARRGRPRPPSIACPPPVAPPGPTGSLAPPDPTGPASPAQPTGPAAALQPTGAMASLPPAESVALPEPDGGRRRRCGTGNSQRAGYSHRNRRALSTRGRGRSPTPT